MNDVSQISEFGKTLIFLITGAIFIGLLFFVNRLLAPRNPNTEKLTSYECGEDPVGDAWIPFNSRFYVVALVFLLFDVEMVFVFPWATVFADKQIIAADSRWGWVSLIEMFVFLGILILGLAYVWVKGDLDWIKPTQAIPRTDTNVPVSLYEKLNLEQSSYKLRTFAANIAEPVVATVVDKPTAAATGDAPARKPMFKPNFKKPGNDA
ncbi:NADH-quinone oxidoreductase subunit A [Mucilaginibacter terrenus]|uniref:NADH-quinone oxidoreductase subunit A n=1 Tax=Mucilaginibacter terrenus TaxID=2482727 RepID=A0A3E2NTQ4_9SPHI|nr:NADH-quinone oxidoreductase subunit A [Mucilaginibacter terrenus]RFZ84384.1 NADH-quinone oxidoreductase subunit A [Mucilaginibacter terrenus]